MTRIERFWRAFGEAGWRVIVGQSTAEDIVWLARMAVWFVGLWLLLLGVISVAVEVCCV